MYDLVVKYIICYREQLDTIELSQFTIKSDNKNGACQYISPNGIHACTAIQIPHPTRFKVTSTHLKVGRFEGRISSTGTLSSNELL